MTSMKKDKGVVLVLVLLFIMQELEPRKGLNTRTEKDKGMVLVLVLLFIMQELER
jgi:hypothetical protein